jgi:tRNA threonylcarbamoyladenosine biosynthesis protein TsaE
MEPLGQPGHQTRFGRGQIHPCHADLGESQLAGPDPNLGHQLKAVDLNAVDAIERHPMIVESTPDPVVTQTVVWNTEADTRAFARQLAAHPALRHAFIELHGELGAGKTTFVRHLLHALGVHGRIKSPTYAVVEPHEVEGLHIWHFDFYRFDDPREWEDAGFRDIFASDGLKLAEWPEKATHYLPRADLAIKIEAMLDESRKVRLLAHTPLGRELLA